MIVRVLKTVFLYCRNFEVTISPVKNEKSSLPVAKRIIFKTRIETLLLLQSPGFKDNFFSFSVSIVEI